MREKMRGLNNDPVYQMLVGISAVIQKCLDDYSVPVEPNKHTQQVIQPIRYNRKDAAKTLGFSVTKLDRLVAAKEIKHYGDGGNVFFLHRDLMDYQDRVMRRKENIDALDGAA